MEQRNIYGGKAKVKSSGWNRWIRAGLRGDRARPRLEYARGLRKGQRKTDKTSAGRKRAWLQWGSKPFKLFAFTNRNGDSFQAVKVGQDLVVLNRRIAGNGRTRWYRRPWMWGFWKRDWRREARTSRRVA